MDHRLDKLARIRKAGINPIPHSFDKEKSIGEFCENEDWLDKNVSTAGRMVSFRKMGKASFLHLQDETGKVQVYLKNSELPENQYDQIARNLDLGDFLGVSGKLFKTKTSAPTKSSGRLRKLEAALKFQGVG